MILETKGMFLAIPTPLQLTMNWCSYNCGGYCFANNNKPDRVFDPKKTFNTLIGAHKNKSITAYFLREKYPLLASNLVDVFAHSNYKQFLEVYDLLRKMEVPIMFQTRGGNGIDEVLKTLPKSAFYISITSHDDVLSKFLEPSAPLPSERIALVKKLTELGHNVAIGINPYMPTYMDIDKLMEQVRDYTDKFWINALHINNNQFKNIKTDRQKEVLKPEIKKSEDSLTDLYQAMIEWDVFPAGVYEWTLSNYYDIYDCYEKKLPLSWDFNKHLISQNKEERNVYFKEFVDFMLPKIPEAMMRVDSGYKVSVKRDYKNLKPNYHIKEILQLHWNEFMVAEGSPLKCRSLMPSMELDKDGNQIYYYGINSLTK